MLRNSSSKYPFISELVLGFRQNIGLAGLGIFIALNWGYSIKSLKISLSYFRYVQMSEHGRTETYPNLISEENISILGATQCFVLISLMITLLLMWIIDTSGLRRSLMTRELRHLSRSVKEKKKLLKDQEELLSLLIEERKISENLGASLLKMEEIVVRYEQKSKAQNPNNSKRTKLSETDPNLKDLFEITNSKAEDTLKAKDRRRSKKSKIRF